MVGTFKLTNEEPAMLSPIEQIKETLDLVEYIQSDHVELRRSGHTFKACCPFHNDRTPSFVVWPETQTWRCFGACNIGGDIFSYVQRRHNFDFNRALHALAAEANVELRPLTAEEERAYTFEQERQRIFALAADHFHRTLLHHPDAQSARDDCHRRGWNSATMEQEMIWMYTGRSLSTRLEVGRINR